jgi:hypothetical protein
MTPATLNSGLTVTHPHTIQTVQTPNQPPLTKMGDDNNKLEELDEELALYREKIRVAMAIQQKQAEL